MKKKYTITVAGMDLNVLSEEAPEVVEAVTAAIDRRIREINLRSPRCSRTEAALLCALDYCCEKNALFARLKEIESKSAEIHGMEERIKALSELLETSGTEKQTLSDRISTLELALAAAEESVNALTESVGELSARLEAETLERTKLEQALEIAEAALEQMYIDDASDEIEVGDEIEIVELEDEVEDIAPTNEPEENTAEAEADTAVTTDEVSTENEPAEEPTEAPVPVDEAPEIPDIIAEELAGQLEIKTPCEVIKAVGEDEISPETTPRKRGRAAKSTVPDSAPTEDQLSLSTPPSRDPSRRPQRARRKGDMFDMLSFDDI